MPGPHEPYGIRLSVASMDAFVSMRSGALRERFANAVALFYAHTGDANLHIVACVPGMSPQPKEDINEIA
jgi:hypothetical protein